MRRALLVLSILSLTLAANAPCAQRGSGVLTHQVPAVARPDLQVTEFELMPAAPKAGDPYGYIKVTVKNLGTKESKDCTIVFGWIGSQTFRLQLDNGPQFPDELDTPGVGWVQTFVLPALGPGKGVRFTFKAHPSVAAPTWKQGDYSILCKVDRDEQVAESDEQNNLAGLTVKVRTALTYRPSNASLVLKNLPSMTASFSKAMSPRRRAR